jgi:hypothetical protein
MRRVFRRYKEFNPLPPYFQKRKQGKREGAESLFAARLLVAANLLGVSLVNAFGGRGGGVDASKLQLQSIQSIPLFISRLPIPFPSLEPLLA